MVKHRFTVRRKKVCFTLEIKRFKYVLCLKLGGKVLTVSVVGSDTWAIISRLQRVVRE